MTRKPMLLFTIKGVKLLLFSFCRCERVCSESTNSCRWKRKRVLQQWPEKWCSRNTGVSDISVFKLLLKVGNHVISSPKGIVLYHSLVYGFCCHCHAVSNSFKQLLLLKLCIVRVSHVFHNYRQLKQVHVYPRHMIVHKNVIGDISTLSFLHTLLKNTDTARKRINSDSYGS